MRYYNKIIVGAFTASLFFIGANAGVQSQHAVESADSVAVQSDTVQSDTVQSELDEAPNESSIIDEVVWIVGDEPILKSDIEAMRAQAEVEGVTWEGDPDCVIPEQIAVQKLFLHQAAIDSIEVTESEVIESVDQQINYWIQLIGSKEKLEEYKRQSISSMRQSMHDDFRDRRLIEKMRQNLVENITVSPADVRRHFDNLPEDSLPYVPTEVEVQIIMKSPKIEQSEINRVKDELRSYTERVTNGETSFAALARLYSEDPGTARLGGEFEDYIGRGLLDPAFANVAFNLTDPKKISKIVETEFGYHIIQLIDKRGDKIKVRHILRKPSVSKDAIDAQLAQLDSIADAIREEKFTFDYGASVISEDKDTRNNNGLMAREFQQTRTSKFRMRDLPSEVAKVVDTLKVGQISEPFTMINNRGKTVCAIVKLKSRVEAHRATITGDFQIMKDVVLEKRRQEFLKEWIQDKLKSTYIKINDRYKNCDFEYEGWIR